MTKRHLILACADLAIRLQQVEEVVSVCNEQLKANDSRWTESRAELGAAMRENAKLRGIIADLISTAPRNERPKLRSLVEQSMGSKRDG